MFFFLSSNYFLFVRVTPLMSRNVLIKELECYVSKCSFSHYILFLRLQTHELCTCIEACTCKILNKSNVFTSHCKLVSEPDKDIAHKKCALDSRTICYYDCSGDHTATSNSTFPIDSISIWAADS